MVLVVIFKFQDILEIVWILCDECTFVECGHFILKVILGTEPRYLVQEVLLGKSAQRVDDPANS